MAYKVVSKLMAKRLKKVLPNVVSETQAAFVEGRLISDNILVAHELLHALSSDNNCALEFIAIKTDISKAYDRVEWSFLEKAMEAMGFSEEWRRLIMCCVSSVRYKVMINGSPFGQITPTRGLRQGDPLSPYLFVMCTEVLVQMLKRAEQMKKISGLRVARRAPLVSHLLFADDSMFYCKGSEEELNQVSQILPNYSMASGQRINHQKSNIYFGKHIPSCRREEIKQKMGIDSTGGEGFYLGLPEAFGGSKVSILSYLKEKLSQRVHGWQTKFLSPGGKEILLKAVAMALPTYTMACFLLPKTIIKQIMAMMSEFWWRNGQETRGMHWKSWESLCRPKASGGLGFKDLEAYNLALLGKQLWRMIKNPRSLMCRVFKSRYFRNTDPLNASLGSRPSYAWRSIHAAHKLIQHGARVVIGNGRDTKIWQERWIGAAPATMIKSVRRSEGNERISLADDMRVSALIRVNGKEWNLDLIERLFTTEVQEQILKIRPAGNYSRDTYSWEFTKTGHYTVKSGYWVQTNIVAPDKEVQEVIQPRLDGIYQQIWGLETSPKIKHFLWKCLSNALPVMENMAYRHIAKDKSCSRCGGEAESVNHLLFHCPYARLIWAVANVHIPPAGRWSDSFYANLY